MYKKILVALENGRADDTLVPHIAELALQLGSELLLVHVAEQQADAAAALVGDCLAETARRWAPRGDVRFIAETSVVRCWADAK